MVTITVNGRFLSQPMTGVQRYATNMVEAIDNLVADDPEFDHVDLVVMCDRAIQSLPQYRKARVSISRIANGYLWEQTLLPLTSAGAIISLGNMGPIFKRHQILTIHDTNVFDMPTSYGIAYRSAYRLLLPVLAHRCAVVASVSQFSWRQLIKHDLVPADAKPVIAGNGHEHVKMWRADANGLHVSADRKFVLIVGSYARHKNFAAVLDAADELDKSGIDIVVAGSSGSVFSEIGNMSVRRNTKFLGRVSDDALCWLYQNASALAVPSIQEGFGLPALEAMALGCPVVSSRGGSLPEVCGDSSIYVDAYDVRGWSKALISLAKDEVERQRLIERGLEQCRNFRWTDSARRLLRCAVAVAEGKPVPYDRVAGSS
jgi:glycosyltransferase involved in cell wall biosynthesis